jgi:hypothetical protein
MADPRAVLDAHGRHAQRAVFSPDGRPLANAGADGRIRGWAL